MKFKSRKTFFAHLVAHKPNRVGKKKGKFPLRENKTFSLTFPPLSGQSHLSALATIF